VAERSTAARHAACEWREPSGKGFLCAVPHVDPSIWLEGQRNGTSHHAFYTKPLFETKEEIVPALIVPILVGIPVLFVGGYYLVKVMH
jgi:hypothetical protein